MIPYRYQEILQALADNPKGLTTAQILKICRSQPGSELPNDTSVLSKLIYSMRSASKYITSSDAVGGAIHAITKKGRDVLAEAVAAENTKLPAPTPADASELPAAEPAAPTAIDPEYSGMAAELLAEMGYLVLDPDEELDLPFIQIIRALRNAYNKPDPVAIERKPEKISTLQRLGELMSDDIKLVFDDIVADLGKLESLETGQQS